MPNPKLGIVGTGLRLVHLASSVQYSNNNSTWTFVGVPLGTPNPRRRIYVAATYLNAVGPSGITLGGNAMTQLVENPQPPPDFHPGSSVWARLEPTGTTATIIVTTDGSEDSVAIHAFAAYETMYTNGLVDSDALSLNDSHNQISVALDAIPLSMQIYAGCVNDQEANNLTLTFSSATKITQVNSAPTGYHRSAVAIRKLTATETGHTETLTWGGGLEKSTLVGVTIR